MKNLTLSLSTFLLIVVFTLCASTSNTLAQQQVGQMVQDITIYDNVNKKQIRLSDLKGQYVMLQFWSSWCPCSAPQIANCHTVKQTFGNTQFPDGNGLEIFSFSLDRDYNAWRAGTLENNINWQHNYTDLLGADSQVSKAFGLDKNLSMSYLIDPQGKIIHVNHGNIRPIMTMLAQRSGYYSDENLVFATENENFNNLNCQVNKTCPVQKKYNAPELMSNRNTVAATSNPTLKASTYTYNGQPLQSQQKTTSTGFGDWQMLSENANVNTNTNQADLVRKYEPAQNSATAPITFSTPSPAPNNANIIQANNRIWLGSFKSMDPLTHANLSEVGSVKAKEQGNGYFSYTLQPDPGQDINVLLGNLRNLGYNQAKLY